MSKRMRTVDENSNKSSDSEGNNWNSDNDRTYQPPTKRKYNSKGRSKPGGNRNRKQMGFPKEEIEHTYASIPLFSNNSCDSNKSNDCSSGSDCENDKVPPSGMSERSTSLESMRSGSKGKFLPLDENFIGRKSSTRRRPCFTKNALMARMNRQRKKEYVEKLEGDISCLQEKNNDMKLQLNEQNELVAKLRNEVRYLRSALSNSTEIGSLLRRVCGERADLKVTSSLLDSPPPEPEVNILRTNIEEDGGDSQWPVLPPYDTLLDYDNLLQPLEMQSAEMTDVEPFQQFGICLHVSNKQVSFEFCESCNKNASLGALGDDLMVN